MINKLVAFLHKLNGADYTKRRIDTLTGHINNRLDDVEGLLKDMSISLQNPIDWHRYLGFEAPLYLLKDGRLALNRQATEGAERAIVISIQKAGTYLLSAILGKLGLANAGVHVWETGFSDYRGKTIPEMVHRYSEFTVNASLEITTSLVIPGQYIVGHIGFDAITRETLASFKRIMAVRELRQCLVSNMRFFANEGRGICHSNDWKNIKNPRLKMRAFLDIYLDELFALARRVSEWKADSEILKVHFEDLLGDNGSQAQTAQVMQIAKHLNRPLPVNDVPKLITSVVNQPTKTWSGKRSSLDDYWSDSCESIFIEKGGNLINAELGYSDNTLAGWNENS